MPDFESKKLIKHATIHMKLYTRETIVYWCVIIQNKFNDVMNIKYWKTSSEAIN